MTNETPGRVWLISGCSSGFGRELVLAALAAGDRVMATARRPETLADLAESGGDRISTAALDVTDPVSIRAAVEATLAVFGRIDVLANNAGYSVIGAVEETSVEHMRGMFDVNFFGAVALTQAVLPAMREQGNGTIVVMSSLGGLMTFPGLGGYNATKHALEALGEALSLELTPLGIRVVVVEPGMFRTQFSTSLQWTPENPAYLGRAAADGQGRRGPGAERPGEGRRGDPQGARDREPAAALPARRRRGRRAAWPPRGPAVRGHHLGGAQPFDSGVDRHTADVIVVVDRHLGRVPFASYRRRERQQAEE